MILSASQVLSTSVAATLGLVLLIPSFAGHPAASAFSPSSRATHKVVLAASTPSIVLM